MTFVFALLTVAFWVWFVESARRFGIEVLEKNHGDIKTLDRMLWHMGLAFIGVVVSFCLFGVTLIT